VISSHFEARPAVFLRSRTPEVRATRWRWPGMVYLAARCSRSSEPPYYFLSGLILRLGGTQHRETGRSYPNRPIPYPEGPAYEPVTDGEGGMDDVDVEGNGASLICLA
jgi:hypothetical protein